MQGVKNVVLCSIMAFRYIPEGHFFCSKVKAWSIFKCYILLFFSIQVYTDTGNNSE